MDPSPAAPAVLFAGVVREVPGEDGGPDAVRLLDGVDLSVERGGLLHVVGPSGAGKSSLVRLINRLDEATAGRIEVLGRPVGQWPVRELRRTVALAFQEPSLLDRSVAGNLRLPFELRGEPPADLDERIGRTLELLGLDRTLLGRDASRLSVGQKQRVALGRALITEPEVLLLDEPTASLDPRSAEQLLDSIAAIRRQRALTVIAVTHRLREARRLGGHMAVLIDGRVAACGTVESVVDRPPSNAVRRFLGED